jgi:DegV family protein with EDD domain
VSTQVPTVAVVTDSTADIPPERAESLSIGVVPALLTIDGETYRDGEGMTRRELYHRLPELSQTPKTASPSPHYFSQAYEEALTAGARSVVSLHLSAKLSGIFNAASQAAASFEERVRVIDSRQVSMGLGFQVLETAAAALEGKGLDEVSTVARRARDRSCLTAMIDTLEYLRRSGRVSWLQAGVGDLLRMKLLVEIADGSIQLVGRVRTRKRAHERLMDIARAMRPFSHFAVLHTAAEEQAAELADRLADCSPTAPLIVEATTVIGAHVGPHAVGFAGLRT